MTTTPSATLKGSLELSEHKKHAGKVNLMVRNHTIASGALGAIPVPPVGVPLIIANCLTMLYRLSKVYGVPFRKDVGKSIISSFLTACGTFSISARLKWGLGTLLPGAVPVINVATTPLLGAGLTYALGHIFIQHFESGGTFLTFDPDKVRGHYAKLFNEGQQVAKA